MSSPDPTLRLVANRPHSEAGVSAPRAASTAVQSIPRPRRSAWSVVGSVLSTASATVAVMVGTLALVLAIASHVAADPGQYTVFGHPVMTVLSGSMSPAIRTGDLVIDRPSSGAQAARLQVGQVISFRTSPGADARVFTHRIHAVKAQGSSVLYQTKGDANNAPDTHLISASQIIGVYQAKVPYGGYVLNALHKPAALALLLASPVLWLVSAWLFALARASETGSSTPATDAGKPGASVM